MSPVPFTAPKREPVYAVKAGATGAVAANDLAWVSGKDTKNEDVSSDVSTPLYYQGRFYVLNSDRKSLTCVEPKTGRLIWERLSEPALFLGLDGGEPRFSSLPAGP